MANAKASPNLEALPTSPSLAQTLPSDAVLDALKMILLGAPLNEVLTTITRLIEAHSTGMLCSIFLLDEDSMHLRYGVAASLPEAYRAATDGICIGPNVGSCGTAAYLRQPVFVSDIASDPRWVKFRDFALQSGLRAAWSTPIMSHDGKVLGTFGMYYREVRSRRIILWKIQRVWLMTRRSSCLVMLMSNWAGFDEPSLLRSLSASIWHQLSHRTGGRLDPDHMASVTPNRLKAAGSSPVAPGNTRIGAVASAELRKSE